jgi:hypothetical protein
MPRALNHLDQVGPICGLGDARQTHVRVPAIAVIEAELQRHDIWAHILNVTRESFESLARRLARYASVEKEMKAVVVPFELSP